MGRFQILDVCDVTNPQNETTNSNKRLLKFLLSDGEKSIVAVEQEPLPIKNTHNLKGKYLIFDETNIQKFNNIIFLNCNNCQFIDTPSQQIVTEYEKNFLLYQKPANACINAPPFIPFDRMI